MKFILSEQAKYLLEERFILQEKIEEVTAETWTIPLTEIKNRLTTNYTEEIFTKILAAGKASAEDASKITALTDAEKVAEAKLDTPDLIQITAAIAKYIREFKKLITAAVLDSYPKLDTFIYDLSNILTDVEANHGSWDYKQQKKYRDTLQANFEKLTVAVNAIINKSNMVDLAKEELEKIEQLLAKLSTLCSDTLPILDILLAISVESKDERAAFKTDVIIDSISNLDKNLPESITNGAEINRQLLTSGTFKANIAKAIEELSKFIEIFNATKLKIETDAADTLEHDKLKATAAENEATHDWDSLFMQAGTSPQALRDLWDLYFSEEWPTIADKVAGLGKAFTQELLNLGFNVNTNPFIQFVKTWISKLDLNGTNYPAIHNAYVRDYIDAAALRHQTMKKLQPSANILFCKDLYTKSAQEILSYLHLQQQIVDKFNAGDGASFVDNKLTQAFRQKCSETVVLLMTGDQDILDIPESVTLDVFEATLKPIGKIRSDFSLCFGGSAVLEKPSADIDRIWAALDRTSSELINAIKYLITVYNSSTLNLQKIAKVYEEFNKAGPIFDYTKATKYHDIFAPYDINESNIVSLITKLANKAGWKKIE